PPRPPCSTLFPYTTLFRSLPVTSNRLEPAGPRGWRLAFPNASALCRVASGTCKCARAGHAQSARKRVLLVGDGASDFCVAAAARSEEHTSELQSRSDLVCR